MSQQPSPYERQYNFTDFQSSNPTTPLPGQKVDQELNAARTAINDTQSRLNEIQADDGKVRNSALNLTTLAEAVEPLLTDAPITAINNAAAAAGAAQISAINTAGTTQTGNINATAAAGVASINAATTTPIAVIILGAEQNALTAATSATNSAANALTNKNLAYQAYQAANIERINAEQANSSAQGYAFNAADASSSASSSQTEAENAADLAVSARNDAEASKLAALEAKGYAEAAASQANDAVANAGQIIIGDVQYLVDEAAASASSAAASSASASAFESSAAASASNASSSASSAATSESNASSSASSADASAAAAAASAASVDVHEAPIDGQQYARKDGGWEAVSTGSPASPADAMSSNEVNGVINASWQDRAAALAGTITIGSHAVDFIDYVSDPNITSRTVTFAASSMDGFGLSFTGSGWVITYGDTNLGATSALSITELQGWLIAANETIRVFNIPSEFSLDGIADVASGTVDRAITARTLNADGGVLMIKEGFNSYLLDKALFENANNNNVLKFNGTTVEFGSPVIDFFSNNVTFGYGYQTNFYGEAYFHLGVNLGSSAFATTPVSSDNSARLATTGFVKAQGYATLASPSLTGTPTAPTAATSTNTTQIATTAFVQNNIASYAPLAGATFTGIVVTPAPTATVSGFRLPAGTAPSSPVAGDFWATTLGVFWRRDASSTRSVAFLESANSFSTGSKQSVQHATSAAGLQIRPGAATVTTPTNGDIWYDSSTGINQFVGYSNSMPSAMGSIRAIAQVAIASGTPSISSKYNVSSITDNGVGDFTLNFTSAMADTSFLMVGSVSGNSGNNGSVVVTGRSTTTCSVNTIWNGALADVANFSVAILR